MTVPGGRPIRGLPPGSSGPHCGCRTGNAVAGDSANGSTVCVVRGSDITVLLRVPPGDGWSAPEATGAALGPARPVPTPYDFAGWAFRALTAGTADLAASRRACPSVAAGAVRCQGILVYRVHVVVA